MLVSNPIRFLFLAIALLFALLPCAAQDTLRQLLQSSGIPQTKFSSAELAVKINGAAGNKGSITYAVYLKVEGEKLTGHPQFVRYNQKTGTVFRADVKVGDDLCCGSPDNINFVDDDLVVSFEFNPSAATLLVLDQNLHVVELMFGFDIERIAPHQVIVTEGMMHFAPIHATRLRLVDLNTGETQELYPPADDSARVAFNKENAERMPPDNICHTLNNDLCDPNLYDEDARVVGTDGSGGFALVASWESSHTVKKGDDPVTIASESVLYLYKHGKNSWLFCDQKITDTEADTLTKNQKNNYLLVKSRCTPNQEVIPDMTTSDFSPFPTPSRLLK